MTFDVVSCSYCWKCAGYIRDCDPIYWEGFFPYCSQDCRGDYDYEETSDGTA